ncbi:hypothetical protein TIFTF001_032268 [Ficus carica]|uniref:Uncharacterized protein n=1 Tax=Ficus carica TaxID=3494 RepID=A0AA88E374_FICCA|nr:hypothetical protein TIFTF001_032268 [Ficus carica]
MRFFKFVSCCGAATTSRRAIRSESDSSVAPAPAAEETRSLVRSSPQYRRRRKRGRLGVSGSGPVPAEWKPSLCSISEDTVVVVVEKSNRQDKDQDRTAGSERLVKRKSGSRTTNVVGNFADDYG